MRETAQPIADRSVAHRGEADRPEADRPARAPVGAEPPGEIRLYEKWRKIYPRWTRGRWQSLRRVVLVALLAVFYLGPWLTWNGHPLVRFNIPERKFILFGESFWPQDFVLLSWLLMIAAFSLFFVTVIAGRVWCGWACPQTVWTLCYVWIEKLVEGDRTQRMRLDRGPWNARRIRAKLIKWSAWALLAVSISFTFVFYFVPARDLLQRALSWQLLPWEVFWLGFPAVLSFLFSGVLREQVCFHMCPYARFQSVMFDRDSLIIGYDLERGEPRGSRPRAAEPAALGLGACIDCRLCVHVCPTGIDIRDGLQYQCIACAACVDVCDSVMDRMGYPRGLIRYSSENELEKQKTSRVRPRLLGYGAVLGALIGVFGYSLSHRVPLGLDIIRDRSRLYREFWDGSVENVYTLEIANREDRERTYRIRAAAPIPLELDTGSKSREVTVPGGRQVEVPVRLHARRVGPEAEKIPVTFTVETVDDPHLETTEPSRFVHPGSDE